MSLKKSTQPNAVEVPYRLRTPKQWEMEWEVACGHNKPMKTEILAIDRKIETIINVLVDDKKKDADKARDVIGRQLYEIVNNMGRGSFIVGHGDGWIEAVNGYKNALDEMAWTAAGVASRVFWAGVFLSIFTGTMGYWAGLS